MKRNYKILLFVIFAGIFWLTPIVGTATPSNDSYGDPLDEVFRLKETLRSDSANVKARNDLGILYMKLEKNQEAINEFERSLKVTPYYPMGPFFSGNVYTDAKRYQNQIDQFQKVIQTNQEYAKAHNNLGLVYLKLENYEEAKKEFEESIKINPKSVNPHNNLGILLEKQGEKELAISKYQDALNLEPDNATTLHNLSLANYSSNNEEHSTHSLSQASTNLKERQENRQNTFTLQPAINFGTDKKEVEIIFSSQSKTTQAIPLKVETNSFSKGIDSSKFTPFAETNQAIDTAETPKEFIVQKAVFGEGQILENIQEPESEITNTDDYNLVHQNNTKAIQPPNEDTDMELPKGEPAEKIKILTVTADIENKSELEKEDGKENIEEEMSEKPSVPSLYPATKNNHQVAETQNPDPVLGDWLFKFPK